MKEFLDMRRSGKTVYLDPGEIGAQGGRNRVATAKYVSRLVVIKGNEILELFYFTVTMNFNVVLLFMAVANFQLSSQFGFF